MSDTYIYTDKTAITVHDVLKDSILFEKMVQEGTLTHQFVLDLITEDPWFFIGLPEPYVSDAIIIEKVLRKEPGMLPYTNPKDPNLCEIAVDANPLALKFVWFNLRTEKLVKKAISANYKAVVQATVELKTDENFIHWCLQTNLNTADHLAKVNPNSKLIRIALFWKKVYAND